jgi:drug/metabolite transporter (DMT)-like permease
VKASGAVQPGPADREPAPGVSTAPPGPLAVGGAASLALLLWSGTAVANKLAVADIDPLTAGVLRSMLAGLIAIVIAGAGRLPLPPGLRNKALLAVAGTASFAAWPMLLSLGLGHTTANHSALIMALIPVFTGLIAAAFDRRAPRIGWYGGAALALVGTVFLVTRHGGPVAAAGASPEGDLIVLAGVGVCALGYVAGGRLTSLIGTRATTFWGLSCASLVLIPVFILLAPRTDWSTVSAAGWGSIAYMTLMSSLLGYALWFWALGHGGISRIGSWQFGQPVMTLVLAVLIPGESVTFPLALAGAVILAGTWLAQRNAG